MAKQILNKWDGLIAFTLAGLVIAHYTFPGHILWVHMLLFWLFQIPILIGGVTRGVRGGILTASIASILLLPHALGLSQHHGLSANAIWMDLISLFVIGFATGWLRDRWRMEQEQGERVRDLRNLQEILRAIANELRSPVTALRGLIIALGPSTGRRPGVAAATQAMDAALRPVEDLVERLDLLRVDSKMGLVRLDHILEAAQAQIERFHGKVPTVSIEWNCNPMTIPASPSSLGASVAALILQWSDLAEQVRIVVSRAPGYAVLNIRSSKPDIDRSSRDPLPPISCLAIARQAIGAHGGRIEHLPDEEEGPRIQVLIPSALRVRPLAEEPIAGGAGDPWAINGDTQPPSQPGPPATFETIGFTDPSSVESAGRR